VSEPIRRDDRISAVLARDERMLDVLLAASPAFSHLRNPVVRKTMAKLATVEHAARVAGIDADDLLARLNATLAGGSVTGAPLRRVGEAVDVELPPIVARAQKDAIIECDVREDLRAGREPFRRILAAARSVADGQVLKLRAIFEPAPLYSVLGRQGFHHFARHVAEDDWCVWFWRDGTAVHAATPAPSVELDLGDDVVVIDVRGLEPPEPMLRTLEALEHLPRGKTLVQINERVPQFLIPQLAARGFVHEVREQSPDLVRLFIRHQNP
jgi:uncharacterized protein (DUF2249 family)